MLISERYLDALVIDATLRDFELISVSTSMGPPRKVKSVRRITPLEDRGEKAPTPRDKTEDTTYDQAGGEQLVYEHIDMQTNDLDEWETEEREAAMEGGAMEPVAHHHRAMALRNWFYEEEENVVN